MTKRALEGKLAVVAGFTDPTAALEQYPTPPEIAAHVVHLADLRGDVAGRTVVDLGSGTGMFALGAALRGASRVVGVELDPGAIAVARENEARVGARTAVHWVRGDATRAPLCPDGPVTVLMNPPFGAQAGSEHADRGFLETAAAIADVSYSIHNAGSESFLESFAADRGGTVTDAFRATLALDRQFDHQTRDRVDLDVEAFRIEWGESRGPEPG